MAWTDNSFAIEVNYYTAAGVYPNTVLNYRSVWMLVSYVDGGWKLDYSDETWEQLFGLIDDSRALYPEGYQAAVQSGRNATMAGNYMYVDPSAVYDGCMEVELRHAWQDESGNLYISFWVANGTDTDRYLDTIDFTLEDETLGEIVSAAGASVGMTVKSKSSEIFVWQIPADMVATGTQPWGNISNSVRNVSI